MNAKDKYVREHTRLRVLRLLTQEPKLSQRDIADRLDVSLGSVNYCLKALISTGLIKVDNFRRSDNKLGYAYILTPRGAAERVLATKRFLRRKMDEYEELKIEIANLQADMIADDASDN